MFQARNSLGLPLFLDGDVQQLDDGFLIGRTSPWDAELPDLASSDFYIDGQLV